MGHWKDGVGRPKIRKTSPYVLKRTTEAIEFMIEQDCLFEGSKKEFATAMVERFGSAWETRDGVPDRRLVEDVCTATRDQDSDPTTSTACQGFVIAYSPTDGGLVMYDDSGEIPLTHAARIIAGDALRQQCHKTENRRRRTIYVKAARNFLANGDHDLGLAISHMEHEIETTGFVSDSTYEEFVKLMRAKGLAS